jgi:hypothetical protein
VPKARNVKARHGSAGRRGKKKASPAGTAPTPKTSFDSNAIPDYLSSTPHLRDHATANASRVDRGLKAYPFQDFPVTD